LRRGKGQGRRRREIEEVRKKMRNVDTKMGCVKY